MQSIVPHYCAYVDREVLLCVEKLRGSCYLSGLYQLVVSCSQSTLNNKYSRTALVQSLLTSLCAFVCVCMYICYRREKKRHLELKNNHGYQSVLETMHF